MSQDKGESVCHCWTRVWRQVTWKETSIDKALYGLKSNSAKFHEHLSATLLFMKYKPSKTNDDLWIKLVEDPHE